VRVLIAILLVLLVAAQGRLWFSEQGLREKHRLEQAVAEQRAENRRLEARNRALAAEVDDLRDGLAAAEERARSDLGLVREDETFYQLVPGGHAVRDEDASGDDARR